METRVRIVVVGYEAVSIRLGCAEASGRFANSHILLLIVASPVKFRHDIEICPVSSHG